MNHGLFIISEHFFLNVFVLVPFLGKKGFSLPYGMWYGARPSIFQCLLEIS
jgi:hypothetical protein